jgi:formylglycine-generating enzyme required for sulfatase activity
MGSPNEEKDRRDDESQVPVILTKGFWLGQHEVTRSEWQRLMKTTPWGFTEYVLESDDYPATYLSWDDAREFCEKLSEYEHVAGRLPSGWRYILPTEAQWEYACRGGTNSRFSFGDDEGNLSQYALFATNGWDVGKKNAPSVAQRRANPWGLFDMHGNAREWCRDWYAPQLAGGADPDGPQEGVYRVHRGGSWCDAAGVCRSASRGKGVQSYRDDDLGFRVAAVRLG